MDLKDINPGMIFEWADYNGPNNTKRSIMFIVQGIHSRRFEKVVMKIRVLESNNIGSYSYWEVGNVHKYTFYREDLRTWTRVEKDWFQIWGVIE
ncbi:MAG: hypothetical protein ACXABY_08770 [Candidatus Thorarchaeota archaeon]